MEEYIKCVKHTFIYVLSYIPVQVCYIYYLSLRQSRGQRFIIKVIHKYTGI